VADQTLPLGSDDPLTLDLAEMGKPQGEGAGSAFNAARSQASVLDYERGYRLVPYSQARQRDYVRLIVTVGLLVIFGWIVVWASVESASWPSHWSQTKEMLQSILPALTGLIGSVIGFYFGAGVNSADGSSSRTAADSSQS
jgi:hypothetical protein